MSRQAHLPPRCPFHRKPVSRPIHDPISPPANTNHSNVFPRHKKSPSQSAILEEQPAWLEDLLDDPDSSYKGVMHRRSASDSITLLDGLSDSLPAINPHCVKQTRDEKESSGRLDLDCIYGPNSPRQKANPALPDSGIVSALSEYISQTSLQFLDGSLCISGMVNSDMKGDICVSNGDDETKTMKRHSGQRSRVRRLQYIAELEKTVNVFQAFESELAVRVASLLQHRSALTMENASLKQKIAGLRQEKLLLEGQYQSMKKELGQLKLGLASSPNSNFRNYYEASAGAGAGAAIPESSRQL
ncbi:basic leucine zipper 2 [Rhodamnia argentea]|uniref:Basic leucine zipper 2 n=1 Tax=Rhodamnia argentea TaxID=178133 RepID=A0A8B8QV15_9MYRT|nr:basic leucine zipper 2 [Rhodamnia argentea]XP_030551071.1 basic leucine zipper 2 [Rhodamnia argentea]XP_030551072.1 basic leucine zipper 2 [Rhodamnia argentea]XP_030551073.1 basic leucine zipper 2 [Rhodamnia argentea]XP_030551075.1 basic leucine zipper 2 [Rhodamnia argentea]